MGDCKKTKTDITDDYICCLVAGPAMMSLTISNNLHINEVVICIHHQMEKMLYLLL